MERRLSCDETRLRLPLELLDIIIDHVNEDGEKETLKSFALASSAFVVRCQRYLFHTIDLSDKPHILSHLYHARLFQILYESTRIRTYVRVFRLSENPHKDSNPNWMLNDEKIPPVLTLLTHIHSFSFVARTSSFPWGLFSGSVQRALLEAISRPTIRSITMRGITTFPTLLIPALVRKRRLELYLRVDSRDFDNGWLEPNSLEHPPQYILQAPPPAVESLTLASPTAESVRLMGQLLQPGAPSLKHFEVDVEHGNHVLLVWLWTVLRSHADSLEHLTWRPTTWRNGAYHAASRPRLPVNLASLASLTTLQFLVNFHVEGKSRITSLNGHSLSPTYYSSSAKHVFSELLQLLEQISSNPHFRRLIIECMFVRSSQLRATEEDWASFDNALSGLVCLSKDTSGSAEVVSEELVSAEQVPSSALTFESMSVSSPELRCSTIFPSLKEVIFLEKLVVGRSTEASRATSREILLSQLPVTKRRGVEVLFEAVGS